jgi:hypothetical protein
LLVGQAVNNTALLAIGPDGSEIIADSSQLNGMRWTSGETAAISTQTTNYATTKDDFTILGDATGGNINVTLTPALIGQIYVVKKKDATANTVTLTPASGNIDGVANKVINAQYTTIRAQWDGTNWWII